MSQVMLDEMTAIGSVGVMIATVVLALFTAWLAFTTRQMALSTIKLTKQENQQHVDNLRPICVLEPSITEIINDSGKVLSKGSKMVSIPGRTAFQKQDPYLDSSGSIFFLKGTIVNSGIGPALHLKVIVRILDKFKDLEQSIPSGVIPVGGSWYKSGSIDQMGSSIPIIPIKIKFDISFNETDYSNLEGSGWEIFLEYQDVFGNPYYTKYTKSGDDFFAGCFKGSRPKLGEPPRMLERQEYGPLELGSQIQRTPYGGFHSF